MIEFKAYASGSSGNLYSIDDGSTKLLVECGLPVSQIQTALCFQLSDITGVLVSHSHADHSKAARDLMGRGLDCYMSKLTADELSLNGHRAHHIEPLKQFAIATWKIKPFSVQHDVPTVGFLLANNMGERFAYITDAAFCHYRFTGLVGIAIEANFSESILRDNARDGTVHPAVKRRVYGSHMSIERVLEMLKANDLARVKQIYLLHLSDTSSDAKEFKRKVEAATGKPVMIA